MTTDLAAALADRLSTVYGRPCEIADLEPLTGGASRETWRFSAITDDGSATLILRRDPPGAEEPARIATEAAAITEAARREVPVPAIVDANSDPDGIGPAYLIMAALPGEALPQRLLHNPEFSDIRPQLPYQLGRILARIHRMDVALIPGLDGADQLQSLFDQYTETAPLPVLDIAFRWLADNRPDSIRRGFVHGDFRNGNVLISPSGIEGVLDWELAHQGDPLEDLGWLCARVWRFGAPGPVGGFGSREELLRGYEDECDIRPEPADLMWWEVFASVRWALICRIQAARADSESGDNALELLAIGRRVTESEFDLLDLLGWTATRRPPKAAQTSSDADLFGRPGADELLAAVRSYITDLGGRTGGRDRYQSRVASHVLALIDRELRLGESSRSEHRKLLAATGFKTEQELALAIRAEEVRADDPAIVAAVSRSVELRLAVVNPRY